MKTVKVIITLIIVTSSSLLSAIISSSQNILAQIQTEFLTCKNKDFGLGIQYPSGWTKEEESKSKSSNVNIVVSFAKQNESKTIVGNKLAWQIEYKFKGIGGITRHGLNSLMINDNTGYSLVFSTDKKSYDRYFPIAQKMVDSFHIKPN